MIDVMKQALKELEHIKQYDYAQDIDHVIKALRQALAQPTKPWIGLDENDFEYQPPQTVLTMKFAEAILKDRNK
jgi:hypothetical protein